MWAVGANPVVPLWMYLPKIHVSTCQMLRLVNSTIAHKRISPIKFSERDYNIVIRYLMKIMDYIRRDGNSEPAQEMQPAKFAHQQSESWATAPRQHVIQICA